jgi:hypothetical protein
MNCACVIVEGQPPQFCPVHQTIVTATWDEAIETAAKRIGSAGGDPFLQKKIRELKIGEMPR